MKKLLQNYYYLPLFSFCVFLNGCVKNTVEPSLDGTWIEINNTTSQIPTGCEFTINTSTGKVSLCGFEYVQPNNVVTLTTKKKARLYAKDGQIFYRQRDADILWIAPISKEDHYFIDYDLDGEFLWIVGETSSTKTTALNTGKVFIKQ